MTKDEPQFPDDAFSGAPAPLSEEDFAEAYENNGTIHEAVKQIMIITDDIDLLNRRVQEVTNQVSFIGFIIIFIVCIHIVHQW
jgi:hypothetical protein